MTKEVKINDKIYVVKEKQVCKKCGDKTIAIYIRDFFHEKDLNKEFPMHEHVVHCTACGHLPSHNEIEYE